MCNFGQQATQNNAYTSTSHYQARPPAAIQMLSDVAAQYFPEKQNNPPGPPTLQHLSSTGSSTVYLQHQQGSPDLLQQNYSTSMTLGAISQNDPNIIDEGDFQVQGPRMEAAYAAYQTALKQIFQDTINGLLGKASLSLLEVSEWLLGHVGDLGRRFVSSVLTCPLTVLLIGLTADEVALHGDRLRLWGEFNTAWLSIFQKQKDMLESGQQLQPGQSLMTQEYINKMAKDLIRMCDAVEKHGLVDYQYGVAEEQIIMSRVPTISARSLH